MTIYGWEMTMGSQFWPALHRRWGTPTGDVVSHQEHMVVSHPGHMVVSHPGHMVASLFSSVKLCKDTYAYLAFPRVEPNIEEEIPGSIHLRHKEFLRHIWIGSLLDVCHILNDCLTKTGQCCLFKIKIGLFIYNNHLFIAKLFLRFKHSHFEPVISSLNQWTLYQ